MIESRNDGVDSNIYFSTLNNIESTKLDSNVSQNTHPLTPSIREEEAIESKNLDSISIKKYNKNKGLILSFKILITNVFLEILGLCISLFFMISLFLPFSPSMLKTPSLIALAVWIILGIIFYITKSIARSANL